MQSMISEGEGAVITGSRLLVMSGVRRGITASSATTDPPPGQYNTLPVWRRIANSALHNSGLDVGLFMPK